MTDTDESVRSSHHKLIEMDAPVYEVHVPGIGLLWFPVDEYDGAFQNATGQTIEQAGGEHPDESEIRIVDFDGPAEVPVADV